MLYTPHAALSRGAAELDHAPRFPETSCCRGSLTFTTCNIQCTSAQRHASSRGDHTCGQDGPEGQDGSGIGQHAHAASREDQTCGRDGSGIRPHAHAVSNFGQVTTRDVGKVLVADIREVWWGWRSGSGMGDSGVGSPPPWEDSLSLVSFKGPMGVLVIFGSF